MPKDAKNTSNKCAVCGEVFVVVSLARICEEKHEASMGTSKT
jgi:hypothetical protein